MHVPIGSRNHWSLRIISSILLLVFSLIVSILFLFQVIKNDDLEELKELGSGTFGTVYHGKWRGTDVAIKRIKRSYFIGRSAEQERLVSRFDIPWFSQITLFVCFMVNRVLLEDTTTVPRTEPFCCSFFSCMKRLLDACYKHEFDISYIV